MPAAVGAAVAGILLAWLTYQRRAIDAATPGGDVRTHPPRRARRASGSTTCSRASTTCVLLGFSRIVGWIDRYLVDGVLNVVSAWTLTAGDDLRTMQTGRAQDYVYGVAVGVLLLLMLWMRWAARMRTATAQSSPS